MTTKSDTGSKGDSRIIRSGRFAICRNKTAGLQIRLTVEKTGLQIRLNGNG